MQDRSGIIRDKNWEDRLTEELQILIKYIQINKSEENDWFRIEPEDELGLKWSGLCWTIYDMVKYDFKFEFEVC